MVAGGHLGAGGQGMEQGRHLSIPGGVDAGVPNVPTEWQRVGLGLCPQMRTSTHRIAKVPKSSQPLHHLGALQRGERLRQAACE